ncbi:MAG: hypothetical protein ACJ0FV_01475 [Gammaproteobacteria bacterium]
MTFLIRFFLLAIMTSCSSVSFNYAYLDPVLNLFSEKENIVENTLNKTNASFIHILYKNREAVFVLSQSSDGFNKWVGPNDEIIFTFDEVIVKTKGLDYNIEMNKEDFVKLRKMNDGNSSSVRVEFDNPKLQFLPLSFTKFVQTNDIFNTKNTSYLVNQKDIGWRTNIEVERSDSKISLVQELHPHDTKYFVEFYYRYK